MKTNTQHYVDAMEDARIHLSETPADESCIVYLRADNAWVCCYEDSDNYDFLAALRRYMQGSELVLATDIVSVHRN